MTSRLVSSGNAVRFIYGSSVVILLIFLAWHFFRYIFFIEGEGVVKAATYTISKSYTVRLIESRIVAGNQVIAGSVLGRLGSHEISRYIAESTKTIMAQDVIISDLETRRRIAHDTINAQKNRSVVAVDALKRLEAHPQYQPSTLFRSSIFKERAESLKDYTTAQSEFTETAEQIEIVRKTKRILEIELARVINEFNDGFLQAPISGVIGSQVAEEGQTLNPGENIAVIYDRNNMYIDWAMPVLYFRKPEVGDSVSISSGLNVVSGKITNIFSVSDKSNTLSTLQNRLFYGGEPTQIVRVKAMGQNNKLDILSRVIVRMHYFKISEVVMNIFADWNQK